MTLFDSPSVPATDRIAAPPILLELEDVVCLLGERSYVCFRKAYGVYDLHLAPNEEVFCPRAGKVRRNRFGATFCFLCFNGISPTIMARELRKHSQLLI